MTEQVVGTSRAVPRSVYRLRDLDRRGRCMVSVFALALLAAPAVAFAMAMPDWAPGADPAFIGLRALDVGTSLTPLIGQPSSSLAYVDASLPVHHLGALHFYLLALPVRVLGGGIGMPLVSAVIVGTCLLVSAWAVFRQLGARAAVVAAVVLGAITFATGAWSMIDPVSSRVAGYPLLCSSILLWCLFCGDLRLLPLATAFVSFTVQQHLSVGPSIAVLTTGSVAGLLVVLVRQGRWRDPEFRRQLARWGGWSAVVALAMWAPVLLDQAIGDGNLGRLADYATTSDRPSVGLRSAFYQVVNTLGFPPLLGETEFSGKQLLGTPTPLSWLSAGLVVAAVVALGVRWRRTSPTKAKLSAMTGLAALAGLANGSSVPVGFEQFRPAFYHWAFVLAFFAYLVIGLGALDLVSTKVATRPWVAPVFTSFALAAIIVPSAVNPALDRDTNVFGPVHEVWKGKHLDELSDEVLAHRTELGEQTVLLQGGSVFAGLREALAFALAEHGLDVRHPKSLRGFVHDDRLVDTSTVDSALVMVPSTAKGSGPAPPGGELVAEVHTAPGRDAEDLKSVLGYTGMRVYLLDRQALLEVAEPGEL